MVPGPLFSFTGPRNVAQVQHVAKMQQVGGLRAGGPTHFFLYESRQILDLVEHGLKTKPIVGGLQVNEIIKYLNGLGANAPRP